MTQVATTRNGFTSVSQSGSGRVWTGLSNMVYPTEGEGSCELTSTAQVANTVALAIPQEAADIPTGSSFVEMALYLSVKKTGLFSSGTNVTWTGKTNSSLSTVWTYTMSTDESYVDLTISGDRSYWKLSSGYDLSAMIEGLKDGTLYFRINAETTAAVVCSIHINAATIIITYNSVAGERASLITTLV